MNMKEIEKILKKELKNFKSKIPKNDNTPKGLLKRMKFLTSNLKNLEKKSEKSINKFIFENNFNDKEINEISDFTSKFIAKSIGDLFD